MTAQFDTGQEVAVADGGWTATIERIDTGLDAAWLRFPGRPDLLPYALEALRRVYGCCEHCTHSADSGVVNRHVAPCPDGCNHLSAAPAPPAG